MKKMMRRSLSLLLCLVMLIGILPASIFAAAEGTESEPVYVLAASDFQHPDGHTEGAEMVTKLANVIKKAGYTEFDGYLHSGDYDFDTHDVQSETELGINTMMNAVTAVFPSITTDNTVLVQGNHDFATSLLSPSGNNDTADYGVYVIHEDDYMDTNSSESTIKNAGAALEEYLEAKVNEGYEKPIFVISHLPLHYSSRTARNGDAKYAHYLFDPMNEAGENGLNIIYLYGHDHAYGYDNYLGGYAVYLPEGDNINIAVSGSTSSFTSEELNFTYMNAGFTGYHCDEGYQTVNPERLSMTVFKITEGQVEIHRFNQDGEMDLKVAGIKNGQYDNLTPSSLVANTDVYGSPQYVTWPTKVTVTHGPTGISVRSYDLTSLNVTVNSVTPPEGYGVYASYNIQPVGYTQGDVATVKIPVDDSFDVNKPVVVLDQGKIIATTQIVNGVVTFTTNHFSTYDIGQFAETEWIEVGNAIGSYIYTLDTDGINYGNDEKYLIVGSSNNYALTANGSNTGVVSVSISNNEITLDTNAYEWSFIQNSTQTGSLTYNTLITQDNGATWLYHTNSSMYVGNNSDSHRGYWRTAVKSQNNGTYQFNDRDNSDWYLYYSSNKFTVSNGNTSNRYVRLFRLTETTEGDPIYAQLRGKTTYTVNVGTSQTAALNLVKLGVDGYQATSNTGANETRLNDDQLTWTIANYDGNTAGTYDVTISYNGVELGVAKIIVEPKILDNDPAYPNPGSIQLDKTATGLDFQNTGLTRVELSTSGLPAGQGADVVVVVDTSSSMNTCMQHSTRDCTQSQCQGDYRLDVLHDSLEQMIDDFNTANSTTGQIPDIDVAIMDFNGYGTERANLIGNLSNDQLEWNNTDYGQVFTGNSTFGSAGAFVDASDLLSFNVANEIGEVHSGTNYDDALKRAYYLLEAKAKANEENGETRDQYVIFLSDGAPFGWNGIVESDNTSRNNGATNAASYYWWNQYLQGTYADLSDMNDDAQASQNYEAEINTQYQFLNNANGTTNPHRWAEAIKGTGDYTVFDRDSTAERLAQQSDLFTVKGLGATVYTIGFGLAEDGRTNNSNVTGTVTVETMTELLQTIASEDQYGADLYWPCEDADDLTTAFTQIVTGIAYAATDARFVDEMGEAFDLQMDPTVNVSGGTTKQEDTSITVTTYPIYTKEDVTAGICTSADVGKSYDDGTVVETVSFTTDTNGNIIATSTAKTETDGNILNNGVIEAQNFFYNTTAETKTITLKDGSTYDLPGETFYWDIGTINEQKYVLSYVVYLTNSLNAPGVAEGSYDTNGDAILYYTNYLGNDVSKSVESPNMPWGGANVSYAFYLVDTNGNPLLADGTVAENFLVSYKVTQPVLYSTVKLNSNGETVLSAAAADVLPEGYKLYDGNAVYTVKVASGTGGGSWTIAGDQPASTYVVGYGGANDYSNASAESASTYDYTHTTVYFAVVWTIGTVPDAVVIDYGIPVDINVMANDMLGTSGKLTGIGAASDSVATSPYQGNYGDATLNVDEATGLYTTVRYTPKNMLMEAAEKFVYQVQYNNAQYYYGDITVIPATTVYYEDNFVTLTTETKNGTAWTTNEVSGWVSVYNDGQTSGITGAVQDEDRPGEYSLPNIDANNLYGYDSAYTSMSQYSLGSAAMVNVRSGSRGKAAFEFYGTGFDVISLTSSTTGTITVNVFAWNDETQTYDTKTPHVSYAVDTYYGYARSTDDKGNVVWTPVDTNDPNALYQVPVMKVEGLDYGKYKVEIIAAYSSIFDHGQYTDSSYDFYLDAIRVYDPAGDDKSGIKDSSVGNAYLADSELYPNYFELRDQLISVSDFDVIETDTISGIVFIDGATTNGADATTVVADYKNFGPNNELYLAPGQAVSFLLNAGAVEAPAGYGVDTVQIAMKTVGGTGSVKIWDAATATATTTTARTISTATDMYYDITSLNGKNVVIYNAGDDDSILSITNVKVTYQAVTMEAGTEDGGSIFSVSKASAGAALMSLRAPVVEEEIPEVTEPEVTEPETTVPEETEPETTVPEETEPEATEPEVTEPEDTEEDTVTTIINKVKEKVTKAISWLLGWLRG